MAYRDIVYVYDVNYDLFCGVKEYLLPYYTFGGNMRISKWINIDQEVEIDLTSEDIINIIDRDSDSLQNVLWGLGNIATFLKGISDSKIAE